MIQDRWGFYFKYDKDTGEVYKSNFRNDSSSFSRIEGEMLNFNSICMRKYQFAFLTIKGYIPDEIDHKDRNRQNNSWNNLEETTHSKNMHNRDKQINNESGYRGVSFRKDRLKYRYYVTIEGKTHTRCDFISAYDAALARDEFILKNGWDWVPLNVLVR